MGILDTPGYSRTAAIAAFAKQDVPAYAPATRLHEFNPSFSVYNLTKSSTAKLRAQVARSQAGFSSIMTLMGHSYFAGSNATPGATDFPTALRKVLAKKLDDVWTGVVAFRNGETRDLRYTIVDAGWGTSNGAVIDPYASCTTAGASLTFVSDTVGTSVRIVTFENSGTFTYEIDGAAPVTVTSSSGTALTRIIDINGLANTTHTVKITATTTTSTYFIGCGVRRSTGLEIVNFGYGGSTSTQWTNTASTQKRGSARNATPARNIVLLQLDTNDVRTGVTAAAWKANMQTIISGEQSATTAIVLIASINTDNQANITQATWNAYYQASYELADQYDIPLVDTTHLFGGWTTALANSITGDFLHLNAGGWRQTAEAVARLLAPAS